MFTGEGTQVPNDQEVGIESHGVDDAQFVIESFLDLLAGCIFLELYLRPGLTQRTQISLRRVSLRDSELGQVIAFESQIHIAAFGDQQGVA